ncbi:hypothetical protein HUS85_27530 [Pseudomonas protegens]|uniref:hypothetical protein n=1 Tax=Pseudomonas protegens TaxID=380021 RepID=UPI001B30C99A|nr:hypothetical protein [Pseudomonas protegens]MBP5119591.1 hypothetical protein [Pseudomonas protegens]QTU20657.1 hypothetical protein HUT22_21820 [Pseudomonas protegens]
MPTEPQHLEQRVAALQSDLNTKDEQIDALTFSDNDRELSRRDWFEAAQAAEKRVEVLRSELASANADKEAYAQNAINLRERLERLKDQRNDYARQLAERDALLERCRLAAVNGEDFDLPASLLDEIKALSASADLAAQPVPTVPDGYCIMPKRLTAENGAKAMLLGEFKLQSTHECPECRELEEPSEGCEICDGEGEYGQKHTIPWDQIKLIYSKAVEGLAVKAEPAKS